MIKSRCLATTSSFVGRLRRRMTTKAQGPIKFGPYEVTSQVFLTTPHSFALVNIKPIVPGHVLVVPHRPHKRLTDLSAPELTDLFQSVQRVQRMLARHYFTPTDSSAGSSDHGGGLPEDGSFNIAVQDGVEAGQTVPHVHVHVLPRIRNVSGKDGDGIKDEIYDMMASEEGNVGGALFDEVAVQQRRRPCGQEGEEGEEGRQQQQQRPLPGGPFPRIEDAARTARSLTEMEAEAEVFRRELHELKAVEGGR
ncbi:HIT-like domain-containing protein [Xylariales sp. PMI_506]|nr:HIT-like domain-containing protein [Xylariales sp. PMI_506]